MSQLDLGRTALSDPATPPGDLALVGPSLVYLAFRRAFDLIGGALLAVPLGAVVAVAAIFVRLDSRGPIFYRQMRVGRDGRTFRMIKIRSMRHDAEVGGAQWAGKNDSRITRIGKFLRASHIDEFPQILNVLRGDMTLIGPRPERPMFVDELVQQVPGYELRLTVKPGVTGLAQLRLPPDQTIDDVIAKVAHDVYYIEHMGLNLDFRVSVGTLRLLVREILQACGATGRTAYTTVKTRLPLRTVHQAFGAPCRLPSMDSVFETARQYTATASLPCAALAGVGAGSREEFGSHRSGNDQATQPKGQVWPGSVEATVSRL
ncbi:sugar transferase [Alienimonas californiensis]|uniref:UDP-N-acetylgalactosamine-undecaprenyl-phosphate N-acetylgalactosaminephosphotransferase n=1 Tax=Alienimonas californiensis TaxID=2527989 RepID=A0A517P471_9PLAN|nr:sugar transferase [Alienimonas californiensis]QDT14192.1 UDP-N-acetylgalactosamine-undecaprenyl-phosphate N-acetylgalactosaminephosphotransferase [Alienimonas californiensis]